jgi:hypothetical protein
VYQQLQETGSLVRRSKLAQLKLNRCHPVRPLEQLDPETPISWLTVNPLQASAYAIDLAIAQGGPNPAGLAPRSVVSAADAFASNVPPMSQFSPPEGVPEPLRLVFEKVADAVKTAYAFRLWYSPSEADPDTGRPTDADFDRRQFRDNVEHLSAAIQVAKDAVRPLELVLNRVDPGRPHGNAHAAALIEAEKVLNAAGRVLLSMAGIESNGPQEPAAVRQSFKELSIIDLSALLDSMRGEISVAAAHVFRTAPANQKWAGDQPVETPSIHESAQRIVRRPPGINARMLETIQANPDALGWNSRQWATHLKCAKSSVVETPTWKDLTMRRERERAERTQDRRRRPKGSDQRRD